ncbi:carboxypeptidase-like regulatory domain-containing protein [Marinicella sp. S1101]|uniref:carboxypeptidase-like regulatory domain-containing protein n=1 Tax=Marinicella marina TaxID=2996016 RepID=UPI002260D026|nr:carboxypeptidase-like regulatory domain-containing protein [Marinicella marina]MCX7552439.1 carboxypeptidase-like regulatory domain-containing protein [Marinicella marina]MDJ1139314.1 carboxypeptidase-like regulatory domain-containing protein [Marinicella marina]
MERFILIMLLLASQMVNADLFSPSEQSQLLDQVHRLDSATAGNNSLQFSPQLIESLQSKQVELIQYFADAAVPEAKKAAIKDLYQALNQALYAAGLSNLNQVSSSETNHMGGDQGIIRGFVRSAENENPLDYAQVYLYSDSGVYISYKNTDSVGRYIFSGLADGAYLVSASKSNNYVTEFYPGDACPAGLGMGCQPNELTPIVIIDGQQHDQINFSLSKEGKITGNISDQITGDGINTEVMIYDANYEFVDSVYSNYSTGDFSFYVADSSAYFISFTSSQHRSQVYDNIACNSQPCDFTAATAVSVEVAETLDLGDITLLPYGRLKGDIKDFQGNPITTYYRSVELYDAINNGYAGEANVDNQGNWQSSPLAAGSYHVRTRANDYLAQYYLNQNCTGYSYNTCDSVDATAVSHNGTNDRSGINFRLRPGARLQGKVFNSQNETTSAQVYLYDANGNYLFSDYTNNDGFFEFTGLGAGTYYLSGHNNEHQTTMHPSIVCSDISGFGERCESATEGNPITIDASSAINKNIFLKVGATVKGMVTDNNNTPLENVRVVFNGDNYDRSVYTQSDGSYEISNLRAGNYYLRASKDRYASVVWPNYLCTSAFSCDDSQGTAVTVAGNSTYLNRNFSLPELGTISFNINDRNGQAVTNGSVTVYNDNNQYIGNYGLDDSGQMEAGLYPDNYYFIFDAGYSSGYIDHIYGAGNCYQNCQATNGTPLSVNYGQNRSFNMIVDKAFVLRGTVTAEANTGNNWKYIKVYQNDQLLFTRKIHGGTTYEELIRYTGQIKVEAYQLGHYSQYYQGVECYGDECGLSQATNINVSPNQSRTIDFDLNVINHIKGRITNSIGQPLSGIQVRAYKNNGWDDQYATTDANGRYEIFGLVPGDYNLRATTDGINESTLYGNVPCPSPCNYNQAQAITMGEGDFLTNFNITMRPRGGIDINGTEYVNGGLAGDVDIRFISQTTGNDYYAETDETGSIDEIFLPADSYRILASHGSYSGRIYTAYPNIECASNNTEACLDLSPTFIVNSATSHVIDDFKVNERGKVLAQVVDETTGQPISGIEVQLINAELDVLMQSNTSDGTAVLSNISSGLYYVFAYADGNDAHQSELFDGVDCGRGLGIDCILSQGSLVSVEVNSERNINFSLQQKPSVVVHLKNAHTGDAIYGDIRVFDTSGSLVRSTNGQGAVSIPVNRGQYYITGSASDYNAKVYPIGDCSSPWNLSGCDLTAATLIGVDDQDQSIDLGLDLIEGINGSVINGYTGEPMAGVVIDFWRNSGSISASTITNQEGKFSQNLYGYYDYLISTDIPASSGLYNEVYNNKQCVDGPAVMNLCDPEIGDWVEIESTLNQPTMIEFQLQADDIFNASFELN